MQGIAEANDAFRTTIFTPNRSRPKGVLVVTDRVGERGPDFLEAAVSAVAAFDRFNDECSASDEHNFGRLEVEGVPLVWQISLRDKTFSDYSPDPDDLEQTRRILLLMLAEEY